MNDVLRRKWDIYFVLAFRELGKLIHTYAEYIGSHRVGRVGMTPCLSKGAHAKGPNRRPEIALPGVSSSQDPCALRTRVLSLSVQLLNVLLHILV